MRNFFESKTWYLIYILINIPTLVCIPYAVFVQKIHVEKLSLYGWLVVALFTVHWVNKFIKAKY